MKDKSRIANILSMLVIIALMVVPALSVTLAAQPDKAVQPPVGDGPSTPAASTGLYIVRLTDASLASYQGGIEGLEATSPLVTGLTYVDLDAPASQAYLAFLRGKHTQAITAMEQTLGRSVEVRFQYLNVLNGMAIPMDAKEAIRIAKLPGVLSVVPDTIRAMDTEVSVDLIGAPNIWNGTTISNIGTQGEGVIVGIIDSGINSDHPSFAEVGGDGYVHTNPYGAGNYAPGSHCATVPSFCNDKLIGAWDYNPGGNPEDGDGHGSHTASTSAGNVVTATITVGSDPYTLTLSGVAPHANIIAYKVCNPGCPGSASVAAVNQAITDRSNAGGVPMVMNYSISGSDNPWNDSVDLAFLEAFNAGILVSASAGNDGPGASTTAKTGGWNLTVGASTTNRVIANTLDVTGPTPVPPALTGLAAVTGSGPAITIDIEDDLIWAGDVSAGNGNGCSAFPANAFSGALALIVRGGCTFAVKVNNAAAAGAIAVVVYNQFGGPPITMGALETTTIPAVMLATDDGAAVQAWASANPGTAIARINAGTSYVQDPEWEDVMAGFSSRGPSQFNTLKPDVTGPGVNILAAYAVTSEYAFLQGTSMSSPHGAGSAALMMALHPTWSPAEIKSAIATTALTNPAPLSGGTANILKEDGVSAADWFDMGGGRLDLGAAAFAGLVLDETYTNFVNANPALGGDPRTLNLHGLQDWTCVDTCVFTRTVSSPLAWDVDWTVTTEVPAGVTINVVPSNFTLTAGGSQELVITVNNSGANVAEWQFANINLTPNLPPLAPVAISAQTFTGQLPEGGADEFDSAEANVSVAAPLSDYEAPTAVLHDNGPLVTHPGGGGGGADASRLQNTSLSMTTLGASGNGTFRLADDFTITDPDGWDLDALTVFSYQTGSGTTSTMTGVFLQIWDGPPNAGGTIIWGDTTTNLMSATTWSNIYRDTETTVGNTTRPIMATTAGLGGLHLDPGTYWLDFYTTGSLASGPFFPPITITGQTTTGNALQFNSTTSAWVAFNDGGSGTPQGLPFIIEGTITPPPVATYCSAPALSIPDNNPTGASTPLVIPDSGNIVDVNVTITATHTWVGDLIFTLSNTNGSSTVIDRPGYTGTGFGCSSNNIAVLLDDEGIDGPVENQCSLTPPALFGNPTPNNPLSVFDGTDMAGTWTMTVSDNAGGDTGTLNEWCITVETGTVIVPVEPAPAHLAVAVFNPGSPTIAVTPDTLESTQGANQIVTQTLIIENIGTGDLEWTIFEDAGGAAPESGTWSDDFESYVAGSNLHGQGGWKGWFNDPLAGALVSTAQALSGANSVDINTTSDLVHEYTNTSGQWTYVANIYIPSGFSGDTYFIMMNEYDDSGAPTNWSVQTHFQSATGNLIDDGSSNTLPFVTGQWAEIRVLIDLDADQHWYYYNGTLLYSGVWNGYNSGAGTGSDAIANVDLYANGSSPVYYDDLELLAGLIPPSGGSNACAAPSNIPWLSVAPSSGTTTGPGADNVTVSFDSTGLSLGVYTGTLCVDSNDVTNPLVTVPVTLSVTTLPPVIEVAPDALANTQGPDQITTWDLVISNTGEADLDWAIDEDDIPNVLYSSVNHPSAPAGTITFGDGLLSFTPNGSGTGLSVPHTLRAPAGQTTITHSASQAITALNSVSCNAGGLHTNNSYLRRFTLSDFGITDPFNVTEVSFGVEQATGATGTQPVTVNLYTWDPGDPFTFANLNLVGSANVDVPDQNLTVYAVPVTGAIPAGATLVVEIFTPNGQTAGNSFFVGSNAGGQTAPSYLAAADCGVPQPTDTAAIGFPNMHIVMNVTGDIEPAAGVCVNPEDIAWASVNPASGTTAGGTASTVEVSFDSTGLGAGVYTGTLCVTSNDLTNPLVTVPLTLTVDESADLGLTKTAPASVTVGDTFTYTLEVTNAGPADALSVTVTDTLPAGVTFVSAAGCTEAGGVVTCGLGDVASGSSVTVEIVVTADAVGLVTNTATVASTSPDPDTGNNSDSADTDVVEAPVEGYDVYLPLISKQ